MKKNFLNAPCMRLLNFAENVGGVTGTESQHSLHHRQPRNLHHTFLLLLVFVSHPFMMVSSISLNTASHCTHSHLLFLLFSFFLLYLLFFPLPYHVSKARSKFLPLSQCRGARAGGKVGAHSYTPTASLPSSFFKDTSLL